MSFKFLSRESVVSVDSRDESYFADKVFIVGDAMESLTETVEANYEEWFKDGIKSKVLVDSKWIEGRVRFTIEFEPDEIAKESELDEIRKLSESIG